MANIKYQYDRLVICSNTYSFIDLKGKTITTDSIDDVANKSFKSLCLISNSLYDEAKLKSKGITYADYSSYGLKDSIIKWVSKYFATKSISSMAIFIPQEMYVEKYRYCPTMVVVYYEGGKLIPQLVTFNYKCSHWFIDNLIKSVLGVAKVGDIPTTLDVKSPLKEDIAESIFKIFLDGCNGEDDKHGDVSISIPDQMQITLTKRVIGSLGSVIGNKRNDDENDLIYYACLDRINNYLESVYKVDAIERPTFKEYIESFTTG